MRHIPSLMCATCMETNVLPLSESQSEVSITFHGGHGTAAHSTEAAERPRRVLVCLDAPVDKSFQPVQARVEQHSHSMAEIKFTLQQGTTGMCWWRHPASVPTSYSLVVECNQEDYTPSSLASKTHRCMFVSRLIFRCLCVRAGTSPAQEPATANMEALSALHCRTCGTKLTKEACFSRVLALPSPFWHEMADMWICHDDFRCLSPISKLGASDLRARPGSCLYGDHELLIHAEDFTCGSIEWDGARSDSLWGMIRCSRCQGPLGVALIENEKSAVNQGTKSQERGTVPKTKSRAHTRRKMAMDMPSTSLSEAWLSGSSSPSTTVVPGADALTGHGSSSEEPLKVVLPDGTSVAWKDLAKAMDDVQCTGEQQESEVEVPDAPTSDVKIYKHWASSCADTGSCHDIFAAHTLLRRCSNDMLQTSAAHANFRFLVRASDAALAPQILVSLMGWCGGVCGSSLGMIDDDTMKHVIPRTGACKDEVIYDKQARVVICMYAVWADDKEMSRALLKRWQENSPNDVEHLDMLGEECLAVSEALRRSTMILPPNQRLINGLAMGFLPI
jgi:hypothetical protein